MLSHGLPARLVLGVVLVVVVLGASACYKNAGENVEPTSNRVDVNDITTPTQPAPQELTPTPTTGAVIPTKITLAPTITPREFTETTPQPPPDEDTSTPDVQQPAIGEPTSTPLASLTPSEPVNAAPESDITTPGMSDIQPTVVMSPTNTPSGLQPTPTGLPVEAEDECIHVVQSGDTLYSIARDNNVELTALVAANPSLLGGSEFTTLQIGWQLQLPGCATPTATPQATFTPAEIPTLADIGVPITPLPTLTPSINTDITTTTKHVVQPGDTVFSIARQYGVTVDAIVQANNLTVRGDVVVIHQGQELIIPSAQ